MHDMAVAHLLSYAAVSARLAPFLLAHRALDKVARPSLALKAGLLWPCRAQSLPAMWACQLFHNGCSGLVPTSLLDMCTASGGGPLGQPCLFSALLSCHLPSYNAFACSLHKLVITDAASAISLHVTRPGCVRVFQLWMLFRMPSGC